jgi:hypothetical protein
VTFRVNVRHGSGVEACVLLGGKKLPVTVRDISAEGMFVTLDRGALAALKADSQIDVEVAFDGDTMRLHGVIRSEHAGGYGIHFPARDRAGRANPIAKFERISASLQRTSLSQRLKILKLAD